MLFVSGYKVFSFVQSQIDDLRRWPGKDEPTDPHVRVNADAEHSPLFSILIENFLNILWSNFFLFAYREACSRTSETARLAAYCRTASRNTSETDRRSSLAIF